MNPAKAERQACPQHEEARAQTCRIDDIQVAKIDSANIKDYMYQRKSGGDGWKQPDESAILFTEIFDTH